MNQIKILSQRYHRNLIQCVNKLDIVKPNSEPIPMFKLLEQNGEINNDLYMGKVKKDMLIKMYENMVSLNIMDKILYESQRQGRISFYMTNYGEEAAQIGSAAAFESDDMIYTQYREAGVFLWRGYTLSQVMNQCYSNRLDKGKGRQMPVHYGDKSLNMVTISSPVATQIPQAAGSAYAFKIAQKPNCVACYFGEGSASEGDAFVGMHFAITLKCPVIFICRNNAYAISTYIKDQYASDGIIGRALGLGIPSIRVDGNDILAMYFATLEARNHAITNKEPVFIEAMTYRVGHHSTSDDSSLYRDKDEIEFWANEQNPVTRLKNHLVRNGWWNEEEDKIFSKDTRKNILQEFANAERELKPPIAGLFEDVYDQMTDNLKNQQKQLFKHLEKYGSHYPLDKYL